MAGWTGSRNEEAAIVALVREFVDRDVRPVVRDLEHANAYPEKLIEQMKELGIFGLAIPEPWGEPQVSAQCYASVTEELARGCMSLVSLIHCSISGYGEGCPYPAARRRCEEHDRRATGPGGGAVHRDLRRTASRKKDSDCG